MHKTKTKSSPLNRIANGSVEVTCVATIQSHQTANQFLIMDSRNWLIYMHFCRGELEVCSIIIQQELIKTSGQSYFANYIQGLILRQQGKIYESLEYFQKCCTLNPRHVDPLKQVARSLNLMGKHRLAVEAFNEARNLCQSSTDWSICYNLGLCLLNMGMEERTKAKEMFCLAIQALRQSGNRGDHEALFAMLAKAYQLDGDLKAAADVLTAALNLFPDSVDCAVALGLVYMDLGNHQQAFEKFGSALAHDPQCSEALLPVGAMMQGHGELDVALAKYKLAAVAMPESASLWSNMGMCFFGKRKFIAAVSCLQRASYLAPFDWKILHNLGLIHLATQQYASAFHYFSAAVNLDALASTVFLPLAVTLSHLGDVKNARYAFEEALLAAPTDPAVPINFALFLVRQEDRTAAAHFYHKFCHLTERQLNVQSELLELANELRSLLRLSGKVEKTPESEDAAHTSRSTLKSVQSPLQQITSGDDDESAV